MSDTPENENAPRKPKRFGKSADMSRNPVKVERRSAPRDDAGDAAERRPPRGPRGDRQLGTSRSWSGRGPDRDDRGEDSGGRGERRSHGDQDRGDRGGYQSRGGRGDFKPRGDRGDFKPRGDRGDFKPRGDRGDFKPRGERGDFKPRGDRGDFKPRDDRGDFKPRGDRGDFKPRGERGDFKPRGDRGDFKPRGDRGDFKPRGDRGDFKPRGDRGDFKPRGERGDFKPRGDRGDFKPRGERGDFKPRGERGDFKPRGDRGDFKPRGDRGGFRPREDRDGYRARERDIDRRDHRPTDAERFALPADGEAEAAPRHPRSADDLVRIAGLNAVQSLFATSPDRIVRLFYTDEQRHHVGEIAKALAEARKPYRLVEPDELERIAGTVLHGGILALAEPAPLPEFDPATIPAMASERASILILDGVGNPHNLGAIARTAAFFGVKHLLLSGHHDQAAPSGAAYRVAQGGLDHLAVHRAADIGAAIAALKDHYRVIGTSLGASTALTGVARDARPVALVLGNEETGVPDATLAACHEVVRIPGSGAVQSLNVAATAAILIYALLGP